MKTRLAATGIVAAAALAVAAAPAGASTSAINATGGSLVTTATAAAPNVAAKANVSYAITNARCTSTGITFTAKTAESGRSGVQQFRQTGQEQEYTGSRWVNITGKVKSNSAKFPNDSRNFSYTRDWTATHSNNGRSHRVVWQGFYLNGSGGALFKTKPIAINCF